MFTNIKTCTNISSDNKYVTAKFNTKEPVYQPKFIQTRDFKNLASHNIKDLIDRSEISNEIFTSNDSDFIAECLQVELNVIYNILAPATLQHYKVN